MSTTGTDENAPAIPPMMKCLEMFNSPQSHPARTEFTLPPGTGITQPQDLGPLQLNGKYAGIQDSAEVATSPWIAEGGPLCLCAWLMGRREIDAARHVI